jgi:hypothetical protein
MTRKDLTQQLGKPATSSPNGDMWRSKGWELLVTYDQNDQAREILRRPAR